MLQECSSWAFRNSAAQMFFLTPTTYIFAGKFVKWVRFLVVLRWDNMWGEICKISGVFWAAKLCFKSPTIKKLPTALWKLQAQRRIQNRVKHLRGAFPKKLIKCLTGFWIRLCFWKLKPDNQLLSKLPTN